MSSRLSTPSACLRARTVETIERFIPGDESPSAVQVEAVGADIAEAKTAIDTLPGLVEDGQSSVDRTSDRLVLDRWLIRWLIRLLIVALAAAVLSAAYAADRALLALADRRLKPASGS